MRQWTYSWNSSDGLRHEGEIRARSKDDAYAELRKQGIRPIRVTERIVPVIRRGFGGLRKRDWTLISVAVTVALAVAVVVVARRSRAVVVVKPSGETVAVATSPVLQEELKKVAEERKALEREWRERIAARVREGSMSREEANEALRAIGIEELN